MLSKVWFSPITTIRCSMGVVVSGALLLDAARAGTPRLVIQREPANVMVTIRADHFFHPSVISVSPFLVEVNMQNFFAKGFDHPQIRAGLHQLLHLLPTTTR